MSSAEKTALVTGSAGFIGGHLAEDLLADGWQVVGIDSLTDFYDVERKRHTLGLLLRHDGFEFIEGDLMSTALDPLIERVEIVFHLAGQPGVRGSWGQGFTPYLDRNVRATQCLLEAARRGGVERFVFASSSSVYGNAAAYPCSETTLPKPHSPYGVTKLAAEHLCRLYAEAWGVPTVALRLFSVYGPRQRPDMAISRIIESGLDATPFPMFGSGEQSRDLTFVSDVVAAAVAATTHEVEPGTVVNVAAGSPISVRNLISIIEAHLGAEVRVDPQPTAPGDVRSTSGTNDLARALLSWYPSIDLETGVARQIEWAQEIRAHRSSAR